MSEAMRDPRSEELAQVCRGRLSEEALEELARTEWQYATSLVVTMLLDAGCEDPLAFLEEKNIFLNE